MSLSKDPFNGSDLPNFPTVDQDAPPKCGNAECDLCYPPQTEPATASETQPDTATVNTGSDAGYQVNLTGEANDPFATPIFEKALKELMEDATFNAFKFGDSKFSSSTAADDPRTAARKDAQEAWDQVTRIELKILDSLNDVKATGEEGQKRIAQNGGLWHYLDKLADRTVFVYRARLQAEATLLAGESIAAAIRSLK